MLCPSARSSLRHRPHRNLSLWGTLYLGIGSGLSSLCHFSFGQIPSRLILRNPAVLNSWAATWATIAACPTGQHRHPHNSLYSSQFPAPHSVMPLAMMTLAVSSAWVTVYSSVCPTRAASIASLPPLLIWRCIQRSFGKYAYLQYTVFVDVVSRSAYLPTLFI